jgi:hypothetical protein
MGRNLVELLAMHEAVLLQLAQGLREDRVGDTWEVAPDLPEPRRVVDDELVENLRLPPALELQEQRA